MSFTIVCPELTGTTKLLAVPKPHPFTLSPYIQITGWALCCVSTSGPCLAIPEYVSLPAKFHGVSLSMSGGEMYIIQVYLLSRLSTVLTSPSRKEALLIFHQRQHFKTWTVRGAKKGHGGKKSCQGDLPATKAGSLEQQQSQEKKYCWQSRS